MKKSFFLYFLVLSPLLFSQNTYRVQMGISKTLPVLNNIAYSTFFENDLAISDSKPFQKNSNFWLTEPEHALKKINESHFSSLLLIRQLNDLDQQTPFNIQHNPTLERYIRVFLKDRRESMSKLMDRASYYFPMFEKYLDKYDLPLEIKYLAIVESALKPDAISISGAKGLWQFMYETGKEYDLQVSSYVDDRFDPLKSTEAACKYLKKLYTMFGEWDLALAAYNSGPSNVKKAIARSGGKTNYWEIRKFLPEETKGYLPAFYATYYIFEYADTHNLTPEKSSLSYIEIDTVHIKAQLSFSSIQNYVPIKNDLLKSLNPQYKREIIPYSKEDKHVLTLPATLVSEFIANENYIYKSADEPSDSFKSTSIIKVTKYNSHIVQSGENLGHIASKYQILLRQLKKWNGLQTDFLIVGQRLVITDKNQNELKISINNKKIPFSPKTSPILPVKKSMERNITDPLKFKTYTVKEGDTLFNISKRFSNITIVQIREWNNILNVSYLKPGTELKIYSDF